MRLLAPAKVNLHLRVGPPSPDGFHPLLSWFCTISLFDTLTLSLNPPAQNADALAVDTTATEPPGSGTIVSISTNSDEIPTDDRNLVVRVAKALADTPGPSLSVRRREGVSVFLAKQIPAGAGLGGGSSDAARALLGLNNLWGIGWSTQRLAEFSSRFGSDIPFFFHGPSSICSGRGEIVRPSAAPRANWALVVLPGVHMPTPAVYKKFDEINQPAPDTINTEPDWNAWSQLTSDNLLPHLINDLEAPAFSLSPQLRDLHRSVEQTLGRIVRMSGSGSSLFTLYDTRDDAERAAAQIQHRLNVSAHALQLAPKLFDDLSVNK